VRLQATAPWHAALRKREELLVVQVSGGGEVIRVARDGSQQVCDAMLKALSEDDVLRLQRGHSFEHLQVLLELSHFPPAKASDEFHGTDRYPEDTQAVMVNLGRHEVSWQACSTELSLRHSRGVDLTLVWSQLILQLHIC
jgi:hypothetical protein